MAQALGALPAVAPLKALFYVKIFLKGYSILKPPSCNKVATVFFLSSNCITSWSIRNRAFKLDTKNLVSAASEMKHVQAWQPVASTIQSAVYAMFFVKN